MPVNLVEHGALAEELDRSSRFEPKREDYRIEERLALVGRLISNAGAALLPFHESRLGGFRRAIPERDNEHGPGRTSTHRSFLALIEYLRYLIEEGPGTYMPTTRSGGKKRAIAADEQRQQIAKVEAVIVSVARGRLKNLDAARAATPAEINMFTDSHLLLLLALLPRLSEILREPHRRVAVTERHIKFAEQLQAQNKRLLLRWMGGKVRQEDEVHDLVTLHSLRALDSWVVTRKPKSEGVQLSPQFEERVREAVLQQMGYANIELHTRFDPAELMFQIALLNRVGVPDVDLISERALSIVLNAQAKDGSWPTARSVSVPGGRLLYASSYEVALALVNLLLRNLREPRLPLGATPHYLLHETLYALDKVLQFVAASYTSVKRDGKVFFGWPDDRSRGVQRIESWATAIVLTLLIHYRDALLLLRQQEVLRRHPTEHPARPYSPWPDLDSALRRPRKVDWHDVRYPIRDPSDSGRLRTKLESEYLLPVVSNWIRRPDKSSLILYGPPGTGKTSVARAMATALHWPLVRLAPTDFLLYGGLEGFATGADKIFGDLMHLRRVVLLLDECEEMFRRRESRAGQSNMRTLGAFITPGMLARVQDLYDRKWIVFVLATNGGLRILDPAVTRRGRFDHAQLLGHPTLKAQIRFLESFGRLRNVPKNIKAVLRARAADFATQEQRELEVSARESASSRATEGLASTRTAARRVNGPDAGQSQHREGEQLSPFTFRALEDLAKAMADGKLKGSYEQLRKSVDEIVEAAARPDPLVPS